MTNPRVKYGDIFSPSHTGHEIVVCQQTEPSDKKEVLFYRVQKFGREFTVLPIEYMPDKTDFGSIIESARQYFEKIYVLAKPLPAHPCFTVRIPYLFCSEKDETWKAITKVITEKLIFRDIPVEIWMPPLTTKQ